jgi:2-C-methyl-D-erythritol 4-phosphate cytidylyltransferase
VSHGGREPQIWAVVVAAGSGSRFGGETPKQDLLLGDRRVVEWSVEALTAWCAGVVVVVQPTRVADPIGDRDVRVVAGGASRSESVRNGIAAVPADADLIAVHDAARPLIPRTVFDALVAAIEFVHADAAIPGVAVTDTIKRIRDGMVIETPERAELVAVQTPQMFRAQVLRDAHHIGGDATDDAALIERGGGRVVVVPGDAMLRKITTSDDLDWLRGRLDEWTARP